MTNFRLCRCCFSLSLFFSLSLISFPPFLFSRVYSVCLCPYGRLCPCTCIYFRGFFCFVFLWLFFFLPNKLCMEALFVSASHQIGLVKNWNFGSSESITSKVIWFCARWLTIASIVHIAPSEPMTGAETSSSQTPSIKNTCQILRDGRHG